MFGKTWECHPFNGIEDGKVMIFKVKNKKIKLISGGTITRFNIKAFSNIVFHRIHHDEIFGMNILGEILRRNIGGLPKGGSLP